MNSDNSQQALDNWVQKRVRNLEGMSRARHVSAEVSAEHGGDKPKLDYLTSKRNSAPVSILVILLSDYVDVDEAVKCVCIHIVFLFPCGVLTLDVICYASL